MYNVFISCIKQRFDQPDYKIFGNLHNIFLNAITEEPLGNNLLANVQILQTVYPQKFCKNPTGFLSSRYNSTRMQQKVDHGNSLYFIFIQLVSLSKDFASTNIISERSFSYTEKRYTIFIISKNRFKFNLLVLHRNIDATDYLDLTVVYD